MYHNIHIYTHAHTYIQWWEDESLEVVFRMSRLSGTSRAFVQTIRKLELQSSGDLEFYIQKLKNLELTVAVLSQKR